MGNLIHKFMSELDENAIMNLVFCLDLITRHILIFLINVVSIWNVMLRTLNFKYLAVMLCTRLIRSVAVKILVPNITLLLSALSSDVHTVAVKICISSQCACQALAVIFSAAVKLIIMYDCQGYS